jgi:hypothetical protein
MSNIKVFGCFITVDGASQNIFACSTNKQELELPYFNIDNPKTLYHEIRYNIQHLFLENMIKFLEEIIISFIDIQNYLLLETIESYKDKFKDINDDDIILLCGVVLHEKLRTDSMHWIPINNILFPKNIQTIMDDKTKIVKYVFDKMLL